MQESCLTIVNTANLAVMLESLTFQYQSQFLIQVFGNRLNLQILFIFKLYGEKMRNKNVIQISKNVL